MDEQPAGRDETTLPHSPTCDPSGTEHTDPLAVLQPAMATSDPGSNHPASAHPPRLEPGDVHAGRYRLDQQLAQRGGTLTWRAFDQKLSRPVLVHVLAQDDPRTPDVLDAARRAAFATDSRFLRVLDAVVGEQPGDPSLVVCEFAPGESMEKLLRQGPLSALEAAWVARELADAMASMHAEGLFHQRINPDTVVITATGNVKIVGFLIEAAMHPESGDGSLAWSEREQADVQAIGKVLYSSLVTRWPTPRDQVLDEHGEPRLTWGMPPAPMDGRGWLTPRQVRSGVSPALDIICDQVLSDQPRHDEMPLRTAAQVSRALSKVLGTADGAADLERRMRYPVVPAERATESTARIAAVDGPGSPGLRPAPVDEAATSLMPPVAPTTQSGTNRSPAAATPDEHRGAAVPAVPAERSEDRDDHPSPRGRARGATDGTRDGGGAAHRRVVHSRPPRRRWLAVLVGLLAVVLLVSLVRVALRSSGSGEAEAPAAGEVLPIRGVEDFDPKADGGNDEENPALVRRAWDGDPATAWTSVVYLNDPRLGRLKPGVGLVVDLGERRPIGAVRLTLKGSPTGVQLRVPKDAATGSAPMGSASSWTTVAREPKAGTSVELRPQQAVESRFVLVYLDSLPKLQGNRYQAGIAEVQVLS